ncbi:GrpB family protein, partial [Saccharothrix algeriensis]
MVLITVAVCRRPSSSITTRAWRVRAPRLLAEVGGVFAPLAGSDRFAYEHIGSTAVPGLAAKPFLDLQVRMPSLPGLAELADVLAPTPFVV